MSTNDRQTDAPLSEAELDLLDGLNRARTPGRLLADTDGRHDARICVALTGVVVARLDDDDLARAMVAAANALPALLAEVRASRRAAPHHVRARDAEGRYLRGWIVATDPSGRVMLDIAMETGERSGHVSGWLTAPERCAVYVRQPSPFEPRLDNTSEEP